MSETREKLSGSVLAVGVSTQVQFLKRSDRAPSRPLNSDPAIGCPPTKRLLVIDCTIVPLMPATSVITELRKSGSASIRATAEPTVAAGVAMKITSGEYVSGAEMTPSDSARSVTDGSKSKPVTTPPPSTMAFAMEPPMSPRPTTWKWRLFREVVTEYLRPM